MAVGRSRGCAGGVRRAQFLDRGFFLFRSEQHFGIRNQLDRVALFPRPDPYQILRLMGTNGANYGIGRTASSRGCVRSSVISRSC